MLRCQQKALIEEKRLELVECVKRHGLSSLKTIQLSQELDILINNYLIPKNKKYLIMDK